jgi:peptidoglycan/xylan/chitin deacetylase (PgdA/CDA1 family)
MVAFTFDDGPDPLTTPTVLAALEKYNIPASFFIVTRHLGDPKRAAEARTLIQREVAAGFMIGSHTAHHANLGEAGAVQLAREVDGSLAMLGPVVNQPIGMFRPPYGRLSPRGRQHLRQLGLTEVRWSIDPRDWQATEAPDLRQKILGEILNADGGVVLLHDVHAITAGVIAQVFDDLEHFNCHRLALKKAPIIPVSLHYFLRDNGVSRPVPQAVQDRTDAYIRALPERCSRRRS